MRSVPGPLAQDPWGISGQIQRPIDQVRPLPLVAGCYVALLGAKGTKLTMSVENVGRGLPPQPGRDMQQRLQELRLLLITGKGGVGRTTMAAAAGLAAARDGSQVLLTEVGEPDAGYSHLGRQFGQGQLTASPLEVDRGLQICTLSAREGHESFLCAVLPVPALARAALRSKAVRKFLNAVPSFHEMGIFYHLLSLLRLQKKDGTPQYDLIVVDMPASGHTLALTGLPMTLLKLIPEGPITSELLAGMALIHDPERAAAWVVTLPEVLPVSECLELIDGLKETHVPVGGVVLNRLPDNPFTDDDRTALAPLLAAAPLYGKLAFDRIPATRRALQRLTDAIDLPLTVVQEFSCQASAMLDAIALDLQQRPEAG